MNEALAKFADMAWSKVFFIAIVVAALFYLVGIDKGVSDQDIASAEVQRKQAEVALTKTKAAMADLKKFRAQIDEMNLQLGQMTAYMTAAPNFSDFVVALQKLAAQSGATVRKISPSNKVEHVDFYETSRVSLELEGRYPQLVGFLSDVSKLRRLVTIAEVDLAQVQAGSDGKNGRISFKATFVGYRYVQPALAAQTLNSSKSGAVQNVH